MNEKKILKHIVNDCSDGYGVFDVEELNLVVPKLTVKQLRSLLKHLEVTGYINIKYSDDKSYCLAPLQKAKELFEEKNHKGIYKNVIVFLLSFFGSFLGAILANLIF